MEKLLKDNVLEDVLVESVQITVNMAVIDAKYHLVEKFLLEKNEYEKMKEIPLFWQQIKNCARLAYVKFFDEQAGFLYIMFAPEIEMCKIGFTRSELTRRWKEIETKLPFEVEVAHTFAVLDPVLTEKRVHEFFKDKRKRGEWFKGKPEDFYEGTASIVMKTDEEVAYKKNIALA